MPTWVAPGFAEERELGSGGSGRVMAAVHRASGTLVAIKYLSPALARDQQVLAGFRAEAELLKGLADRHVVRLYEYIEAPGTGGPDQDSPYGAVPSAAIVMELVDGVSLHEMITQQGPTAPESALAVLKGSLLGLAAAHALGIVHRDYKPENVLVNREGISKLTDFGVAARTGQAADGGTPLYMAPEQWHGAPATPATDIYAASAVFFECLTGMTPFSGQLGQLAEQHSFAEVPVRLIDEPLRDLIARGMAKDPAARPANAAAFVAELEGTAAAAYGAAWEDRGRSQLAERAAALLLALFGAGTAATGAGTGTATTTTWLGTAKTAIAAHAIISTGITAAVVGVVGGSLIGIHAAHSASSHVAASQPAIESSSSALARVTAQDLLSVPVPAACEHPAGELVNGSLPGIPTGHGDMELAWITDPKSLPESAGSTFGHLAGDGTSGNGDAAAVLYCDAGNVSWPEIIAFYGPGQNPASGRSTPPTPSTAPGPRLLAWTYITDINLPGITGQNNAFFRRISYQHGAVYAEWSTQDNGDPAAALTLDYSGILTLAGGKIVATNLVGVTERPTAVAFASDLRAGNQAAADGLAAPGVGQQAAGLFRSYPSALAASPTCYALDPFTLPGPLANLINSKPPQISQLGERLCAFPSTDPGASWVAMGMERTGWRTWRVLWTGSA